MAVLDYDTLTAFMHPSLMDSFSDADEDGQNITLKAAVKVAISNYNALTSSLPEKAVVRFDSVTYQLKMALCHVYTFILHDVSYLTDITLTGLGLSEDQVYQHFKGLLDMEREDLEAMKKQLLDEIKDKEDKENYTGVILYHGYASSSSGSSSNSSSTSKWVRRR